jgi:hypothetical protein
METEGSLPGTQETATGSISRARWIQSALSHPVSLRPVLILSLHLRLGLPSGLVPSDFPSEIFYAFLIFPVCVTCRAHRILHVLTTLIIFGAARMLWNSSLCSLPQSPSTSFLLGPNILLSTLFSNTLSLCTPLVWETKLYTHTKCEVKLWFFVF